MKFFKGDISFKPGIFFVLWALFLSFEFFGFGPTSYVKVHDNAEVTLALKLATASSEQARGLWEPQMLAGTDRLTEVGAIDLMNGLFAVLPGWLAYGMFIFIQRFVAGYFTYKLLHEQLKLRPIFAVIPALLYSMFSQEQINLQFDGFTIYDSLGLPGVPAVLYLVTKLASSPSWRARDIFIAATLLGFLYSAVSFYAYTFFFFPLLAVWLYFFVKPGRRLAVFCSFFLGWLTLETVDLVASYNFSLFSQRVVRDYCATQPAFVGRLAAEAQRQVLGGTNLAPVLVTGIAVLIARDRDEKSRLYRVILIALAYLFASALVPFLFCSDLNPIPLLRGLNTARFFLYTPFLFLIAAAISMDVFGHWHAATKALRVLNLAILLAMLTLAIGQAVSVKVRTLQARMDGSNYADIYLNPYLQALSGKVTNTPSRAVLLFDTEDGGLFHAGFLWPYGIDTLDGYANIYPYSLAQFWSALILPMTSRYDECRYGIRILRGETRLYLSNACETKEEIDISRPSELFNFSLLRIANVRYVVSPRALTDPLLDEIDTSQISCPGWFVSCRRYFLYEYSETNSFLTAYSEVVRVSDLDKILNRLRQLDATGETSELMMVESELQGIPLGRLGKSETQLTLLPSDTDHVTFEFTSQDAKIVVVSSMFTPDWKVFVDGKETRLLQANYIFKGVFVPAGDHHVEMVYAPKYSPAYIRYWLDVNFFNEK